MESQGEAGRINQRRRTRKDILAAAARLLRMGRSPGMDDVAAEAGVSRATVYRYFPSVEALLVEAPLDGAVPGPAEVFGGDPSTDPVDRADRAEAILHDMVYRNEGQLRAMLAASLQRGEARAEGVPVRQNRRMPLIRAALAPARSRMSGEAHDTLCAALALMYGVESMVVFSDVLGIGEAQARRIKSWAVRALVRAAMEESEAHASSTRNVMPRASGL
ncbi:MAG: TetR/AcrR family transcriptional regulator [Phycisphaerales bacterium]|nr:TetR/AcrR family transcriptional regulator [Phycisphaerales bacterium]